MSTTSVEAPDRQPLALPTEEAYERATRLLGDAMEEVSQIRYRLRLLAGEYGELGDRHPDDALPDLAAVGRAFSYAWALRQDADALIDNARWCLRAVEGLDLVRLDEAARCARAERDA